MGIILQIAGALICALVLAQLAVALLAALRRAVFESRQQALAMDLLCVQVDTARKLRQKCEGEAAAWNGYRKFMIERKVRETENICSFYLKPHDRKPLAGCQAGQYLTFRLNLPGQKHELIRCYSLSDRPRNGCYRVTIKKLSPGPGQNPAAPGLVSTWFCDHLKERDIIDVKAPCG